MSQGLSFDPTKLSSKNERMVWCSVQKIFDLTNHIKNEYTAEIEKSFHEQMSILKGCVAAFEIRDDFGIFDVKDMSDFEKFLQNFLAFIAQIPIDSGDLIFLS